MTCAPHSPLSRRAVLALPVAGMSAATVTTQRLGQAAAAGTSLDRSRFVLTFSDEFKGPISLYDPQSGAGRWKTTYDWDHGARTLHDELQIYSDPAFNGINPFQIRPEGLAISADVNYHRDDPRNAGRPYTSGLITTSPSFRQKYGYFEMEGILPAGAGLWPTFWLAASIDLENPRPQYLGEIDVVEMLGRNPSTIYLTAHYPVDADGSKASYKQVTTFVDGMPRLRRYGMMWTVNDITWFIDDVVVGMIPNPGVHRPMMLLANLAVGGSWGGAPTAETVFPAYFLIRSIRAFRVSAT